jgi:mono/diheme cytochrome c family protein
MKLFVFFLVAVAAGAQGLPKGEGFEKYDVICGGCHGADIVIGMQNTREGWEEVVDRMKSRGAVGTDAEMKVVTDYLVRNFGPKPAAAKPATAAAKPGDIIDDGIATSPFPAKFGQPSKRPKFWWIFMPWTWF